MITTLATLAEAVLTQRRERMNDAGPSLRGAGTAHFQLSGGMLLVNSAQPRPGKADEMIERINRFARERWLAVQWTFTHGRDDPQLEAALTKQQYYTRETLRLMGCIGELLPATHVTPDIIVAPIATLQEMQTYERISSWGFNHQQHPTQDHVLVRGRERWDEQQAHWYQYYLGRLRGEPVSGAYVSLWERVPTIYGVATIPPARQHGLAGHVLRHLVRETLAMGFAWTCLYVAVGNHAEQLYQSLGFSALLDQTTYQLGESRW
jgi:GNAT superfamily N-acetyltransferase